MLNAKKAISVTEALSAFDWINPVMPRRIPLGEAIGLRAAENTLIRRSLPEQHTAAIDGWATSSAELAKATARKPVPLPEYSRRIDRGDPLPPGCDTIIPEDIVILHRNMPASQQAVVAHHGVVPARSLCQDGDIFLREGERITINTAIQGAVCGIGQVLARRPVVDIICNTRDLTPKNDLLIPLFVHSIRGAKAMVGAISFTGGDPKELALLLQASSADVIATVGGTGNGSGDTTLEGLSEVCNVLFHGVRMNPGGSVAFSMIGTRPVFSLPGNHLDILAVNAIMTASFARKVYGRPPRPAASRQGRLLTPLPGGKECTTLYFGKIADGSIEIIGDATLKPQAMATADTLVVVMEGDRHKRVGEMVSYLKL